MVEAVEVASSPPHAVKRSGSSRANSARIKKHFLVREKKEIEKVAREKEDCSFNFLAWILLVIKRHPLSIKGAA